MIKNKVNFGSTFNVLNKYGDFSPIRLMRLLFVIHKQYVIRVWPNYGGKIIYLISEEKAPCDGILHENFPSSPATKPYPSLVYMNLHPLNLLLQGQFTNPLSFHAYT
jgi:hypothetical protein